MVCSYAQEAEKIEVSGAIQIGDAEDLTPDPGIIRWTGSDFEGWNGSSWMSLTFPFIAGQPTNIVPTDIVLLDSVQSYVVPNGKNLYISSLKVDPDPLNPDSAWADVNIFEVNNITFRGFGTNLSTHHYFLLGEGMALTSRNIIYANGFLVDKKVDLLIHDLAASPYTVPAGKTLYITNSRFSEPVEIDGVSLTPVTVVYSNQTLSSDDDSGVFIGFLR